MRKRLLLLLSQLLFALLLFAQTKTITGTVRDALGKPIAGASVTVKNSSRGTVAGADGSFNIAVSDNEVLQISSSGYVPTEVAVASNSNFSITLQEAASGLGEIVLIGTRRMGRVKTETPVPVDVINVSTPLPTARMDLTSLLNFTAPSFNYNKQSGSDGADHVDLATLRGLGPDQTLVLVNGKRRHQTAFVSVFGTRGRGNSGTDLNAIPISAIERVEILRDGASAQYGSDAIAGVINIVLKNSIKKFTATVGASGYNDPDFNPAFKGGLGNYEYSHKLDGRTFSAGANYGFALGKRGGFINLSADYLTNGKTFRQSLDTTDPVNNPKGMIINPYRRANGDASLEMAGGVFNLEAPLGATQTRFYSVGTYNHKSSDAFAFTRDFTAKPERFPTDAANNLIPVPGIIKIAEGNVPYYNPHIQTKVQDASWVAGVRGTGTRGWNWDLSNTIGYNRFHFYGDKTFNASVGAGKTHFDDGGFSFLQNTVNLNRSKEYSGIAQGFNFAYGAEYRYERYSIFAGEPDSYRNANPTKVVRYDDANQPVYVAGGAQGFPGYQPGDEVKAHRSAVAAYADAELDVTSRWLVNGAVRLENYSDFGFTHNYKLATRLKVADHFNIRGSFSTGFRAPSLQQINFSSTFTTVQGGTIAEVKIAPNYSSITKAAGIPKLKQERSLNGSVGFTYSPIPALNITVDGYMVRIKNRVVLSGQFAADDAAIDPALAAEMARLKVSLAQFFANAVNTTNKGLDMVVDYNRRWALSHVRLLFAGNVQDMKLSKINVPAKLSGSEGLRQTFLSDREQAFIRASAPGTKLAFNAEWGYKKISVGSRLNYFGKVTILGYGEDGLGINPRVPTDADESITVPDAYHYGGRWVTDFYASIQVVKGATLHLGVDNAFNVHPALGVARGAKYWAYNNEPAGPFDAVQMGGNGRRFFTRLVFSF